MIINEQGIKKRGAAVQQPHLFSTYVGTNLSGNVIFFGKNEHQKLIYGFEVYLKSP